MSVAAHHVVITADDGHFFIISDDHQQLLQLLDLEFKNQANFKTHLYDLLVQLHRASIVDPAEVPRDVVTMDCVVELTHVETKEREIVTLVYPESANATERMVSVLDSLGTAILGCRIGDVVSIGAGRAIKIEDILYQPEHYQR